jgi:hypothetical protein
MQAVTGFKHLYLRKTTFYFRLKLPKRVSKREVRLCLRTDKLTKAVILWELLQSYASRLKQLVISSRTSEASLIRLQLTQIKDAMLKRLEISDIDPLIAKLEQGYSARAHAVNVLGEGHMLDLDDDFKELYIDIVQNNPEHQVLEECLFAAFKETPAEKKDQFMMSLATLAKTLTQITDEVDHSRVGYQAGELLAANGFEVDPNTMAFHVLTKNLKAPMSLQVI